MAKVRLYQDIDCCLNASHNARAWRTPDDIANAGYMYGFASPTHDDFGVRLEDHDWRTFPKYKMEWNSRLVDAMNELDVDLVWATTWRADAPAVGQLMGLTLPSRVLHPVDGRTTFPSLDWKFEAIRADLFNNPGPSIWVEDELTHLPYLAQEVLEKGYDVLLVAPDPNLGVTPKDIERMKTYIGRYTV